MEYPGHTYTVELRLYGRKLNPDVITRETGLQPCQARFPGYTIGPKKFDEGRWAFDGGRNYWRSLEEGLTFVLD